MTRNGCPAQATHRSETCSRASTFTARRDHNGRRYYAVYCDYYCTYVRRNTRRLATAPERPCTARCSHYYPLAKLR